MPEKLECGMVKLFGWKATVLFGDPLTFDRYKWLKHHLQPGAHNRTLDAGCGNGAFTIYASSIGNQAIGISSDERGIWKARAFTQILDMRNIEFIQADLRELHLLRAMVVSFGCQNI